MCQIIAFLGIFALAVGIFVAVMVCKQKVLEYPDKPEKQ